MPEPAPEPMPEPAPEPIPAPTPNYVAPFKAEDLKKPEYPRPVKDELVRYQPKPSQGTHTGYSTMDSYYANTAQSSTYRKNLTEKFYGTSEEEYAKRLGDLKTSIDTTQSLVGVIDSGLNRNNKDMIGANVHDTQVKIRQGSRDLYESSTFSASGDHGTQMASIIAGNNGMTNAKIYGSDTIGTNTVNGNQFKVIHDINKRYDVKIFNNSWGSNNSDNWYNDALRLQYNKETGEVKPQNSWSVITLAEQNLPYIHDLIINKDVLMLKASGNEGKNDAYDENLAPLLNDKFKDGYIVVSSPPRRFCRSQSVR
ncbi:S8 family serine peptidase [Moraxella lacunata]|nr:S8 family serine peptidase [Moraxella lacunata]